MSDRQIVPPREPIEDELFDPDTPLDIVADYFASRNLKFAQEDENINVVVEGSPVSFTVSYSWDPLVLTYMCHFHLEVLQSRVPHLETLLALVNKRLEIGHFQYCAELKRVGFRIGIPMPYMEISHEQVEWLFHAGLNVCESFIVSFRKVAQGAPPDETYHSMEIAANVSGTA